MNFVLTRGRGNLALTSFMYGPLDNDLVKAAVKMAFSGVTVMIYLALDN